MSFSDDATTVPLARFRLRAQERFFHEYDFYKHWVHKVHVEQLLTPNPTGTSPLRTGGERAAPPTSTMEGLRCRRAVRHPLMAFPLTRGREADLTSR